MLNRFLHGDALAEGRTPELDADSPAAIAAAVIVAVRRNDEAAHGEDLVSVLNHSGDAFEQLLTHFGGDQQQMHGMLEYIRQFGNAVERLTTHAVAWMNSANLFIR